jgi:hypothetical protein
MNVKHILILIIFIVPCVNKIQCMLSKELNKTKQTKIVRSSPGITNIPSAHIKQSPTIRQMQHVDTMMKTNELSLRGITKSHVDWVTTIGNPEMK